MPKAMIVTEVKMALLRVNRAIHEASEDELRALDDVIAQLGELARARADLLSYESQRDGTHGNLKKAVEAEQNRLNGSLTLS